MLMRILNIVMTGFGYLIALVIVVALATYFLGVTRIYAPIGDSVAEIIYPDLAQPTDREPPPTFRHYLPSPITLAVLGGQGRGLNCSIPDAAKVMFQPLPSTADVSLHFRPSCVMHDLCYRHGYATYGYTQADCDLALQASAFRMCRQVNGRDYDYCQTQAKKVLLGVSLRGAKAYRPAGQSTWFEYDPIPEKANDYVVARAYKLTAAEAEAGELGVWTYHFFRNTVTPRTLKVDPADPQRLLDTESPAVPWPRQYVPTPPTHEWIGAGKTAMLAVSRKGFSNTKRQLMQLVTSFDGSQTTLSYKSCPAPLKNCQKGAKSINTMANVSGSPLLVSLGHLGSGTASTTMVLERRNLESGTDLPAYRLNGEASITDRYRFLQNGLLLEKDHQGYDTHAWVLAHGLKLDGKGHVKGNAAGKDYEKQTLVIRQALADGEADSTQRFLIDAAETGDPLSLVRLAPGSGVALLGLGWEPEDLDRLDEKKENLRLPVLSLWQLPEQSPELIKHPGIALPPELLEGFIDRPPVVVDAGIATPVIVWTRMLGTGAEAAPDVTFDVLLTALDPTQAQLPTLGSLRCTLKLKEQVHSPAAEGVRTIANRRVGAGSKAALTDTTEAFAIAELARRWKMSQTLVSQRPAPEPGRNDLAITAVFNGFPGLSLQVVLRNDNGHFSYSHRLPQSPHFACGPTTERQAAL